MFGPYPVPQPYNSWTYCHLLEHTVFPEIRATIGEARWRTAIWQQVATLTDMA